MMQQEILGQRFYRKRHLVIGIVFVILGCVSIPGIFLAFYLDQINSVSFNIHFAQASVIGIVLIISGAVIIHVGRMCEQEIHKLVSIYECFLYIIVIGSVLVFWSKLGKRVAVVVVLSVLMFVWLILFCCALYYYFWFFTRNIKIESQNEMEESDGR